MKAGNFLVISPYYSGTSFEDIALSLRSAAKKSRYPIEVIGPSRPLRQVSFSQDFLDDDRYIVGQARIMDNLCRRKRELKKVLFLDFFNPGLDLLKYALTQEDLRVKIGSLLHGGSFVAGDLYSFGWIKDFERGWASINNVIYVSSKYLESACPAAFKEKTKIYPWGMDGFTPREHAKKKWDVIFPHRLQADKGAHELIQIVKLLPQVTFLITAPLPKGVMLKNSYHKQLSRFANVRFAYGVDNQNITNYLAESKVVLSTSIQETFGYSVMKAVACGCHPVLPRRACYPEFFKGLDLYRTTKGASQLVMKALSQGGLSLRNVSRWRDCRFSFRPLIDDFFG